MSDAAEVRALIELAGEVESWGSSREGWNAYQADLAKRVSAALNSAADALEAAHAEPDDEHRKEQLVNSYNQGFNDGVRLAEPGARVPVSRDELVGFLRTRTALIWSNVEAELVAVCLSRHFDIYAKADRKPPGSSNGDDRA